MNVALGLQNCCSRPHAAPMRFIAPLATVPDLRKVAPVA